MQALKGKKKMKRLKKGGKCIYRTKIASIWFL